MTYCCENCGFLFQRVSEVQTCPFCESYHFRSATAQETDRLHKLLNQTTDDHKEEMTR